MGFLSVVLHRIAVLCAIAIAGQAAAADVSEAEYQIKAAFLFNFAKFVQWPDTAFGSESNLQICVLGDNPISPALSTIENKTAQGRNVVVRRSLKASEAAECNILYVADARALPAAGRAAPGALTVSDSTGFAEAGGMIGLVTLDNKVRFEVNLDAINDAGLKVSAQLLKLAKAVYRAKGR